jgi:predicted enzyme related to lactoylglutathione lyase
MIDSGNGRQAYQQRPVEGISGQASYLYYQADLAAAGLEKRVCFAYPPMEVEGQGGLRIAQFKDPDGNVIGIMKSPAM